MTDLSPWRLIFVWGCEDTSTWWAFEASVVFVGSPFDGLLVTSIGLELPDDKTGIINRLTMEATQKTAIILIILVIFVFLDCLRIVSH